MNKIRNAIDEMTYGKKEGEIKLYMPDDIETIDTIISALEKQAFFENTVDVIREWFVGNKDCLLDTAQEVAKDKFIEISVNGSIDKVDLDFIVEDIIDEIQKGILNVLNTFKEDM